MSNLPTEPLSVYNSLLSESDDDTPPSSPLLASHIQATAVELEAHRSVLSNRRLASVRKPQSESVDLQQYALGEISKHADEAQRERSRHQETEKQLVAALHERDEALQSSAACQRREKVLRLKISSQEETIQNLRSAIAALEADSSTLALRRQQSSGIRFVSKKPVETPLQCVEWAEAVSREAFTYASQLMRAQFMSMLNDVRRMERSFPLLLKCLRKEQRQRLEQEENYARQVLLMTESRDSSRILRHFRSLLAQLSRQQEEEVDYVPQEMAPVATERTPPMPPWYPPGKSSSLSYHPTLWNSSMSPTRTPSPSPRRRTVATIPLQPTHHQPPPHPLSPRPSSGPVSRAKSPVPYPVSSRSASQQKSPLPTPRTSSQSPTPSRSSSVAKSQQRTAITYLRLQPPKPVAEPVAVREPRVLPLTRAPSETQIPPMDVSPIQPRARSSSPSVAVAHDIETLIKQLERWKPAR